RDNARRAVKSCANTTQKAADDVKEDVMEAAEEARDAAKDEVAKAEEKAATTASKASKSANKTADKAKESAASAAKKTESAAASGAKKTAESAKQTAKKAEEKTANAKNNKKYRVLTPQHFIGGSPAWCWAPPYFFPHTSPHHFCRNHCNKRYEGEGRRLQQLRTSRPALPKLHSKPHTLSRVTFVAPGDTNVTP